MEPKVVGREQDSGETEKESVRDRALLKTRDGMGNKFDHWRKYLREINLRQLRCPPKIVFPQLEYFLCESVGNISSR